MKAKISVWSRNTWILSHYPFSKGHIANGGEDSFIVQGGLLLFLSCDYSHMTSHHMFASQWILCYHVGVKIESWS